MNIFTDGACSNNGKSHAKAGVGIYIEYTEECISENIQVIIKELLPELNGIKHTNNVAELLAILKAINISEVPLKNGSEIFIYTDSMYCINSLTKWYKAWEKNNWNKADNKPVLNKEIIQEILKYLKVFKNLKLKYTPAHKSKPNDKTKYKEWFGNNKADELAVNGAN